MAYIWGGSTGIRTPQEAKRLRDVAEAMASRGRTPSNIGEGLSAIGDAIASRRYRMRADRMESEGREAWKKNYGDVLKSYFTPGAAAPAVPEAPDDIVQPQPDLTQAPPEYPMGVGGMLSPENAANTPLPPAEDMAAIVRTVYGEAGNQSPEGQRAVAEVILNRARQTGMTPLQVVMAEGQFEPWQTRAAELNALDPSSPQYQSVLGNITPAFGPDDPTGGADYFYSPGAQAALGRDTPDWAQGQTGTDIGDHRFYSLGYGGEPGASGAQDAVAAQAAQLSGKTGQPDIPTARLSIESGSPQAPQQQPGIQQVADSGGIDPQRIIDALSDPWVPDGQKAVLQAILEQRMKEMAPPTYGYTELGGDLYRTTPQGTVERVVDIPPEPEKPTTDMQNYEYAKQSGFEGSFDDWLNPPEPEKPTTDMQNFAAAKAAGYEGDFDQWAAENDPEIRRFKFAQQSGFEGTFEDWQKLKDPLVTVQTGDVGDPGEKKQREAAGTEEGKRWDAMEAAGSVAGTQKQQLLVLDELIKTAPQGPLTGKLAEMFPGFTSAGAVFNSITKGIAPTLRTPGAGATSDIEYEGMLNQLARLSNYPKANQLINDMMKAKADINIERADVVTAWRNEELTSKEARKKLSELNKRSIMTPGMRSMLDAVAGEGKAAEDIPEGIDPEVWQHMTPEERALWP